MHLGVGRGGHDKSCLPGTTPLHIIISLCAAQTALPPLTGYSKYHYYHGVTSATSYFILRITIWRFVCLIKMLQNIFKYTCSSVFFNNLYGGCVNFSELGQTVVAFMLVSNHLYSLYLFNSFLCFLATSLLTSQS